MIKSRRLRWAGHVARMGEGRSAIKILTGKLTRKIPLGRLTLRWEDDITKDLKEMYISVRGIGLVRLRDFWRALVNVTLNRWLAYAIELVNIYSMVLLLC